ncbi:MAG TPA: bifunctional transaldolase/phosoglucose isomerase [Gemmatimonadales bacterium]|jgi:transaldolase/glucose-6-phosphate isomerase
MFETSLALPDDLQSDVRARLAGWRAADATQRLWNKDALLWTGADEPKWLGWLDEATAQCAALPGLVRFAAEIQKEGTTHAAVLGMGGSSLCPYVFARTFGPVPGWPRLEVLDSTDPQQIRHFEASLDLPHTMFIVSSKSGSTLEPNILRDYFLSRMKTVVGDKAAKHFIAVTDPGSQLEKQAMKDGFRMIFPGDPEIGGRFSALSNFGTVPASLAGIETHRLLDGAEKMQLACRGSDPATNPGVLLGVVLAAAAAQGRDKLTIFASPEIGEVGAWLEQLIAESTGKQGTAIIPVANERVGRPDVYGKDRLFVHLVANAADPQSDAIRALEQAGHPVVRFSLTSAYDLGAEFLRWEIATAVAGSLRHINPFNQPDVEASKIATRKLTDEVERTGSLPAEEPFHAERGIKLFADQANRESISKAAGAGTLVDLLRAHFARLGSGDYAAVLAYVEMTSEHETVLQSIRHRIRDRKHVATTLGFGPRFLHSTGQAHKGGPNTGVFLQVTADDAQDLPVPGHRYSFGTVKAAQARGDLAVLDERGRRALRVHIGKDVGAGLAALNQLIQEAVS